MTAVAVGEKLPFSSGRLGSPGADVVLTIGSSHGDAELFGGLAVARPSVVIEVHERALFNLKNVG